MHSDLRMSMSAHQICPFYADCSIAKGCALCATSDYSNVFSHVVFSSLRNQNSTKYVRCALDSITRVERFNVQARDFLEDAVLAVISKE